MATVMVGGVSIEAERFGGGRTPWAWVVYAPDGERLDGSTPMFASREDALRVGRRVQSWKGRRPVVLH